MCPHVMISEREIAVYFKLKGGASKYQMLRVPAPLCPRSGEGPLLGLKISSSRGTEKKFVIYYLFSFTNVHGLNFTK